MSDRTGITFGSTALASRQAAAEMRDWVEKHVGVKKVTLDFTAVETMTHGYADELFAVYAERHGLSQLVRWVDLVGVRPNVQRSIDAAIRRRCGPGCADGVTA